MEQKLLSIGLTGGIGSGKTTVANLFAARGIGVVDTDAITHSLTGIGGAALPEIKTEFGNDFIAQNGAMNRVMMRNLVFQDPTAKKRLESILHPMIREECDRCAREVRSNYIIFVVPLLAASEYWRKRVSRILVVDCPEELQVARVIARNAMSEEQVRAIMATQSTRNERLAIADDVIMNDGNFSDLEALVDRFHQQYEKLVNGF